MPSIHSFKGLGTEAELADCARLLREAFGTVAREFALTEDLVPTNAAFSTPERLREYIQRPAELYGMFIGKALIGCVAIERKRGSLQAFYIERLAVSPGKRHQGHGDALLSFACQRIREEGGTIALLGVMDNNQVLKDWYKSKGFRQKESRTFAHLPFKVCFMSKELEIDTNTANPREQEHDHDGQREHKGQVRR
jgi:diamine N-acetyltransferase